MSLRRVIILFTLALLLQLSAVASIAVRGQSPNLVLCLAIAIVFYYNGGYKVLPVAGIAMLVLDMATGYYAGIGPLVLLFTMGLVLLFRRNLNTDNFLPLMVTSAFAVALYDIAYWGIMRLLGYPMSFMFMIERAGIHVAYDMVIIALIYLVMSRKKSLPDSNKEVEFDGIDTFDPKERRANKRKRRRAIPKEEETADA